MDGHDKRFVIPVYQRNYNWKKENCEQLYNDLIRVAKNHLKAHFFGCIVAVHEDSNNTNLIIDGQQRLTTVSLLLLAMCHLLKQGKVTSNDPLLAEQIYEVYIIDRWKKEDKRIKLKPVNDDNKAYLQLFKSEDEFIENSDITINYKYFCEQIQKQEITIDELYDAIKKLQIIHIELNRDDNPQLIFESLNSTGVNLNEGDKIRNYVLMGLSEHEQEEYFNKYWSPIEKAVDNDVSIFMRDYLRLKTQQQPPMSKVYRAFKEYVEEHEIPTEELFQNLFMYAKYYEVLIKTKSEYNTLEAKLSGKLRSTILRLNWLETTVTRPFLMEVLRLFDEEILNIDETEEVFLLIEDYIFRRKICDVPTNALNKIFTSLNRSVIAYDQTTDNYVEKMKYSLKSRKESGRYPSDEEFLTALSTRNIYQMSSRIRSYIMERYENFGTREVKNVFKGLDDGTYSIEHIMPQNLTIQWQNALGKDYETVHETWLHRLANLTLTAYNSNYSNDSFLKKRDLIDSKTGLGIGFSNSGLRMNQWIGQQNQWTLKELEERNQRMMEQALKIWPYMETEFVPKEKDSERFTLDEKVDATGYSILSFSYQGNVQNVKSWVDAYMKIIRILHQQDASVLTELAYNTDENDLSIYFTTGNADPFFYKEVQDGIYAYIKLANRQKLSILRRLFKKFHADPQDLEFTVKHKKQTEEI
ncbi:DUF262 domain-containing protein [Catenisphaera adipataccumulans]|uniref:Uncharacterized protein with ParB-like and HNH nuclease domain n=1 Tax=Catenisphaera adipataccumulans TaxID=700500 RepID=A0A7W8CWZ0_9FIRM|nr:DUF262 domain-containing protein [Catenisphaera adipataccumulans]MBB5182489.1 uncharacterized protein with ParB-like and HNH nuclease domain [Catenisphaera adipataccumulans]